MKKDSDAVSFMRKPREEIDAEGTALTWEERSAKTLALLEDGPLWQRLRGRRVSASDRGHVPADHPVQRRRYGHSALSFGWRRAPSQGLRQPDARL